MAGESRRLGIFEKYLTLWIAICIVVGLLLGRFFPAFGQYLDSLKFAKLSIPIGICLFFMMYPTVVGIAFSDVKKAVKKPKPMLLTIIANWVITPPLMTLYANLILQGNPQYIAGVILLGMSPCTAMVMWWIMLAKGDLAQGLINTAINALLMLILYAPQSAFYLGVSGIPVPWDLIAMSVIVFIALPVSLGAVSRKVLIGRKGKEWFDSTYLEIVRKISIIALLLTLIVMFSFQGEIILNNPLLVAYLAAPNLLIYATMIAITYITSWLSNWDYPTSIDTTLIGSSSHFEVAIAVATTLYGLNSGAALATVIGPLMEVPLMLSLVRFGLRTRHLFPRNKRKVKASDERKSMKEKESLKEKEIKKFVKKRYSEMAKAGVSCCPSCECGHSLIELGKRIGYSDEELRNAPEASNMGLGCGNPVALAALKGGETVLDLGSGGGIDVFLAAKRVGHKGKVIGVDMTEEMIERAKSTAKKYGYKNVEFRLGEIENLPVEDNSIDVIISNCVINLSSDKEKVFRETYRALKNGGKIMISDLVTEGEMPEEIKKSFDAWAGCIAGALEKNEYLDTIRKAGFQKIKIASESSYDIGISEELKGKITSVVVEAYKVSK